MSLEELMRKPDRFATWSRQRRKFFRVIAGVVIAAIGLIVTVILVLSFRHRPATEVARKQAQTNENEKDVAALAELMRVRKDTRRLSMELRPDRRLASGANFVQSLPRKRTNASRFFGYDPGNGFEQLKTFKTELYIPTGAVFQAQLLTPIKTSVEKTFVMAETTNEFRMDLKRRILPSSRLIGSSHFDPILKAVIVEFNTLVSPSGMESPLSGLALSRNALPEIEGLYFSDKLVNYGTALAFGFLSGFAGAGRERESTIFGSQPEVSIGNQVLSGLSVASFQVANQILNDIRSRSIEYVVVPAGERVFVVLTRRYDIAQNGSGDEKH